VTSAPATYNRGGLVCETDLLSNSDAGVGLEGQDRVHELASAAVDAAEPARSHARGSSANGGGSHHCNRAATELQQSCNRALVSDEWGGVA
jgi:hypothetical protein